MIKGIEEFHHCLVTEPVLLLKQCNKTIISDLGKIYDGLHPEKRVGGLGGGGETGGEGYGGRGSHQVGRYIVWYRKGLVQFGQSGCSLVERFHDLYNYCTYKIADEARLLLSE